MSTPNDKLLKAARLVEAHSHANADGSYTVDESAMNAICRAIKQPRKAPQPQPPQGEQAVRWHIGGTWRKLELADIPPVNFAGSLDWQKKGVRMLEQERDDLQRQVKGLLASEHALQAQRDELLAACKARVKAIRDGGVSMADLVNIADRKIEAAIARATQGGQGQ